MMDVLRQMGDSTADMICSNPNFCVTQRIQPDGSRVVNLLNVCSNGTKAQKYEVTFRDGTKITGQAEPCKIETIRIS